jgi:hypothetical protein
VGNWRKEFFEVPYGEKSWEEDSVAKNPDNKPPLSVINLPSTIPKPPSTLGDAGATLWRSIMAEYDISDAGGRAVLEQAAAAYDRAERLRVEIDRDGEIVRGRTGVRAPRSAGRAGGASVRGSRLGEARVAV